jgi:hypothetical protein
LTGSRYPSRRGRVASKAPSRADTLAPPSPGGPAGAAGQGPRGLSQLAARLESVAEGRRALGGEEAGAGSSARAAAAMILASK